MTDIFWIGVVCGMFTLCMLDWLQDIVTELRRARNTGVGK